ncbi:MAG TPA: type I DNA topoisomerase [Clostridia bacterium]|nr:type I DNA topoisomerase [Clostridia bacterium]
MSKSLVIVESPAKARNIKRILGQRYNVIASMGHVRDLPKSQFGVDLENDFEPKYITVRGKGPVLKELRSAAKKSKKVFLASDPDREGEAIAWHLQELLKLNGDQKCRIEFNEITKSAIKEAVKKPRAIDYDRVNAQQARRILDRIVGYKLSPLLWRKVKKGLSAGRVQSVAVRIICEREEEIKQFIPEEYWSLFAHLAKGRSKVLAKLHTIQDEKAKISNALQIQKIVDDIEDSEYSVTKVTKKELVRRPPPPFTTSSMQQEASNRLNFNAKKTMMIAQQLYEGLETGKEGVSGLVTYIRTDSTRVSAVARKEAAEYIKESFDEKYVGTNVYRGRSKGKVQDAHEAIRPTSISRAPLAVKKHLTRDQYRLYSLIWSRFLASQMSAAIYDTTSVDIGAGECIFRASGSVLKFPGFKKVYSNTNDKEDKEKSLPELKKGDVLKLKELEPKQHFTQPPPRYTDASLIKILEEKGIGRPSTYAPTIETILRRGYVAREKKQFHPTELGSIVVDMLKNYFEDIIDAEFTADLEKKLDSIEEGDVEWVEVLSEFYEPFKNTLEKAEKEIGKIEIADEVTDEVCEKCGRNLVIKMGRYGKFLACPGFPECTYTKPLLEPIGVKCPNCKGELVARRSRKGRLFYGCSGYPDCKFVLWDRPIKEKCPECGGLMTEKSSKSKTTLCCINEECGYKKTRAN